MNDEKLNEIKSAYELSPENKVLQNMYYNALKESGKWIEAESILNLIIKDDPNNLENQIEQGRLLYKLKKTSKGILLLENALELGNKQPEVYKLLILLYTQEKNSQQAKYYYKQLIKAFPNYHDDDIAELFEEEEYEEDYDEEKVLLISESDIVKPVIPLEKPDTSFADVGGMKQVKEDIAMKIINPIKHADLFKQYGKKIGGGILLYGPPGCGKTHIARATAGEIDAAFFSIGINDVLDMYLGQSEKQLHYIFEHARENTPSVLFFDEVDALGASRNDMRHSAGKNNINQFLQELDGINATNDGILVLGATNAPWHIDSAFKRPGRFDQIIFIPPPDEEARFEILKIQTKDKPKMEADLSTVAKKAINFTGADLKALVDATIEAKLRIILDTGKETSITTKDFLRALKKINPSSIEWFETAKNYAVYSNQSGMYDDILKYLNIKKP